MMGLPCLRVEGAFFASLDTRSGDLIVKLDATEVARRVEAGSGRSFAPAGKTFREWVAIDTVDEEAWRAVLGEALAFVRAAASASGFLVSGVPLSGLRAASAVF